MPRPKKTAVSKVNDIVSEPIIKEPKEHKEHKEAKIPKGAFGATPERAPQKSEDTSLESLINLVVAYTDYSRGQARNLITAVIARENHLLVNDVIEWCTHVKDLESQQRLVEMVANGSALVEKIDGKWTLLDRVNG